MFTNLLKNNNIKKNSRKISVGAVFAECFNCTSRDLLKRPVFEKCDVNWRVILPTRTEQKQSPTKLTLIHGSLKKNEG